jgi:hypothetical protein
MKKLLLSAALGLATLAGSIHQAQAASPSYVTKTANGTAAYPARTVFASQDGMQIRIVSLNWQSDSATAVASFRSGEGAYYIRATNPSTSYLTQFVNTTIGMITNSTFILERAGVGYACVLTGTNNLTNAVFFTGAFGVQSAVNDNLYQLGSATTIPVGATTNAQNGEALYVGNVGRPVSIELTPSAVTNRINSATGRYE